jgi:alpha-glucosidase
MKNFFLYFFLFTLPLFAEGKDYRLLSPNERNLIVVQTGTELKISVFSDGIELLKPSVISMTIDGNEILGKNPRVIKKSLVKKDEQISIPVYKKKEIIDHYNELTLSFEGKYALVFRAYNDGVAYRFITDRPGMIKVYDEKAGYNFNEDYMCWAQYVNRWGDGDKFYTTFENSYSHVPLSKIAEGDSLIVLPMIVDLGNKKIAITEADLESYPGMFLKKGIDSYSIEGIFAGLPGETTIDGDEFVADGQLEEVIKGNRKDFIAETVGKRSFPWRTILIADEEIEFLNSDMVYKLASPSRIVDESWIKPGKVAWDWWIECDLWDVDFKSGVNFETYKEYIDFASENKLEYIIIDVGFSEINDVMKVNPDLRIKELISYANNKEVGIIAWCGWLAIRDQMEQACKYYSGLGIKGFKIDYMNRDDQYVNDFYYKLAETAANHHLLLNFHGAAKPAGLQRTYPNVLSFEGVKGQEWCRWTNPDQPGHVVTFPFLRMLAGPVDFTPGVFRSESKERFKISWIGSMAQGTRAHQMAMYTVFESPLQMLSDSPSRYREEQECTDFIAQVPTVWDETLPLDGKIGDYIVMARRTGNNWYVGAVTSWSPRNISLSLSFLPEGKYTLEIFSDGVNADRYARDYKKEIKNFSNMDNIDIKMESGGGWTAKIVPDNQI